METSESPVVHAQWNWDEAAEKQSQRMDPGEPRNEYTCILQTKQSKTLYSQGFVLIQLDLPLQVNPNDCGLTPMFGFSRTGFDFSQK